MTKLLITCFADEISHDLTEQMDILEQEGVKHVELRGIWGKNVMELTRGELESIRDMLHARGFAVSSIGSPIGKYPVTAEFGPQLDALKQAIEAAQILGTSYIRIFSYYPPEEGWTDTTRAEAVSRVQQLTRMAEEHQVVLILENDSDLYGSLPELCLELLQSCESPALRMAFDPGNFIQSHVKPMQEAYPILKKYIDYIHMKDSRPDIFVPVGEGDAEIRELIAALKERQFSGFLSVEPHLAHYLPHASNPKRVVTAVRALQKLLTEAGLDWN